MVKLGDLALLISWRDDDPGVGFEVPKTRGTSFPLRPKLPGLQLTPLHRTLLLLSPKLQGLPLLPTILP